MKLFHLALLAVLVSVPAITLAQSPASASLKHAMTIADLMAIKRVSDPQVSPSGKWVMFSVTDVSLDANTKTNHLWVVPLGGGKERQITFGDGESNGRLSPDGKQISFSAKDQIELAPWNEVNGSVGTATTLTRLSTGADGAIWSPDSKRLLFVSSVYPECSDKGAWAAEDACDKEKLDAAANSKVKARLITHLLYRHWDQWTGDQRSHVLVVSARDGSEVRDLTPSSVVGDAETPTFSLGGPLGYAWAPDSHEIAYVANLDKVPAASTNNDIFTLKLDEPNTKAVKISTSPGSDDGPQYSPDGKWLAFRSQARAGYESDQFRLMALDRKAKTTVEVAPNFKGWIDEFVWGGARPFFFFTSSYRGEERIYGADFKGNVQLVRKDGEYGSLSLVSTQSHFAQYLIATKMQVNMPSELVKIMFSDSSHGIVDGRGHMVRDSFDIEQENSSQETEVTHVNAAFRSNLALAPLEPFDFTGAGGTKVQGFVVKPPNFNPAKKYPVKFLIHGGPQGAWGDSWSYRWNPELMAASGYVVVMINPRGSTGYGQAFIEGVSGDWGGKPYIDLMNGLDYAEQHFPFIDKTRECALGASYGGYMADWILTHTDRFKCIVTHDGMYDPAAFYGTTDELWFAEWEFRQPGDPKPGQPWRYAAGPIAQDPFRKWSPALSIQNAKTPTLVIHSQKDYRLDVSQGMALFTALQRLGVPSEFLYFPDENHFVQKPQNAALWNKTVSDWCDRWTHTNAYAGTPAAVEAH
jgi:dipeptidyl aminopeptidase/acylaminoacyl peptidase